MYVDENMSESARSAIVMRDAMMDNELSFAFGGCTKEMETFISSYLKDGLMNNKIKSVKEFLVDLQKKSDAATAKWLDGMADKGWIIDPVSDPWGYYAGE